MKICFFHYLSHYQGGRVWLTGCVNALRALGHEVAVVEMDSAPAPSQDADRRNARLKRYLARYLHEASILAKNLTAFPKEWRIISKQRPEFLIIRYKLFRFSALLAAKWRRRPVILWVHGPGAHSYRQFEPKYFHYPFLAEWIEHVTWRLADAIVVVSTNLKHMLIAEGVAPERITVIPNGVDLERFSPSDDGMAIRARHSLQDRVVIGHTGTLAVWHGVDHLSCVIRELLPRHRNVSLLIVGDGEPLARLSKEAELAGVAKQLVLTGRVPHDEMPRYLAAMDITIAPFTVEAYGAGIPFYGSALKLFEYLAMGKPVVAARIGQIAEVIEDGKSGLLYDPADGQDLVQRIAQLIEQPGLRQALGREARQAVQRYSWLETARVVEALGMTLVREAT